MCKFILIWILGDNMKKSWLVLLLGPCLSFAAYPIYEQEFSDNELSDKNVLQHGLAQEPVSYENEEIALEKGEIADEAIAVPQPRVRKQAPSRSISPKRLQKAPIVRQQEEIVFENEELAEEVITQQPVRKQSAFHQKHHPKTSIDQEQEEIAFDDEEREQAIIAPQPAHPQAPSAALRQKRLQKAAELRREKALALENNSIAEQEVESPEFREEPIRATRQQKRSIQAQTQPRSQAAKRSTDKRNLSVQKSIPKTQMQKPHSNRPRVTHHTDTSMQEETHYSSSKNSPMQKSKAQTPYATKKAGLTTQRSNKVINRDNAYSYKNKRNSKYRDKYTKSHHPGHRPLGE